MFQAIRLAQNPIIKARAKNLLYDNINGPSLISIPKWISNPLGKYYLYFAHHKGKYIRLAYADQLRGKWKIYDPGTLHIHETPCYHHIASPDILVDNKNRIIRLYYHGVTPQGQKTFVATSRDGIHFTSRKEILGPYYFRIFRHKKYHYALAKLPDDQGGVILRSENGLNNFIPGPRIIPYQRHVALLKRKELLYVFFSRGYDCPERILTTTIDLKEQWKNWKTNGIYEIIRPEKGYEGVRQPLIPSAFKAVYGKTRQLRDPAIYTESDKTFLLYTCAGENGICIAELI